MGKCLLNGTKVYTRGDKKKDRDAVKTSN